MKIEESRVFVVPRGLQELEFINLKIKGSPKTLVVSKNEVFEVREVGPPSAYDPRPEPKFPSGEPVKSFIFEAENGGFVKENANIVTLTKYDMLFPVLCSLQAQLIEPSDRFKTEEDLLDDVVSSFGVPSVHSVIKYLITSTFADICERLEENGETFYKIGPKKVMGVLDRKVTALKTLLLSKKSLAFASRVEDSLGGELLPSQDILEPQTLKFSVDYIFNTYLTDAIKQLYFESIGVDFSALDTYIADRERRQKAKAAVEENRAVITQPKPSKAKTVSTKTTKKKPAKVAVGKGALDSFFARK